MNTITLNHLRRLVALALVALALVAGSLPRPARAFAGDGEDAEMQAVLDSIGHGSPVERLRRVTGGRAGWPNQAQAAEQYKVLRESEEFAPAAQLPHTESGPLVERVRRVMAPLVELHGGENLIVTVLRTQQPMCGVGRGSVVILSDSLLSVVSDDELLGLLAHEFGHQYFRREFAQAEDAGDKKALRRIEFKCDAIAVLSLLILNRDANSLVRGLAWARGTLYSIAAAGDTSTHPNIKTRQRFTQRLAP